ncbi:CARDB domain-containing protein [Nocardioides gansuensis]|uniref:CARDB domain-containing protein n=1 Tax=Nocardioides gansuensis TaxID=2138300 RepID=UPI000E30047F|nr:CARDB domain-containing protein [Nocardioides gansuensis]
MSRFRSILVCIATLATSVVGLSLATPTASADPVPLTAAVTPSATTVPSGSSLTYAIHVENTGGQQLDEVELNMQLNGMTSFVLTSTVGSCSQSENLITCHAGSLEGFQGWDVTVRGTVTAADGTTLHNGATVNATHSSNTLSVSDHTDVLVSNAVTTPKPDLRVSVQGPTSIGPEQEATFNLTVNNQGNAHAVDVRVDTTLPLGFQFLSATANSLFTCAMGAPPSRTVVCTGGRINSGTNATITIIAKSAADADAIELTSVVDPFDEIDELNELNNTGSLLAQNQAPPAQQGLTITKSDDKDPVRPGHLLTYTINVKNIATTRADNVAVVDTTQGLDAASIQASTTKGVCTVAAPQVICTQKSPTLRLNPGETMDITITGRVVNTAGSLITNTATVSGNIKNKGVTNTAKAMTTVNPGVDLTVVQHAVATHDDGTPPNAFRAWDHFDYEIAVGNSGLDDATDVVVREKLAPGVVLDPAQPPTVPAGVTCAQVDNVVTCTGLDVQGAITSGNPSGTVEHLTLHVIAPPETGVISAEVTVDPNNVLFESDESNNVWVATANVTTGIDLTVSKKTHPEGATFAPSSNLVYVVTVTNLGTQDSTGITVRDLLPAGTRFREVVGDSNFTCNHNGASTGGVIECVGGRLRGTHNHTLAPDFATITIRLFAPAPPGAIKNQVRVDPDGEIDEIREDNNINTLLTNIQIGGCCVHHEFTIDKVQVSPDPAVNDGKAAPSGIVNYDLVVANEGSDVAFDVVVEDHLADGMVFRHAEDSNPGTGDFTCQAAGRIITCTGGTLDGSLGQTAQAGDTTRTIHVSVFAPAQPGSYINQAIIDPDNTHPEANETNNQDQVTTIVALGGGGSYIDLKVDSSQSAPVDGGGNPTDVVPSGNLQYTLKLENVGTAVAFNVNVRDTIPAGATFRSAKDRNPGEGAFDCGFSDGVVTCTGGTLDGSNNDTPAAGDNVRFVDILLFAPPQPGTYTNQAVVDPDGATAENDETNNSDQTATNVRLSGGGNYTDLKVKNIVVAGDGLSDTQLSDVPEPQPGQAYSYEVTVENTGTDPAYNVAFRNVIDPGVRFVSVTSPGNDFSCIHSSGVVLCDGGVLDGSNDLDPTYDTQATVTINVKAPMEHDRTYPLQSRIDPANTTPEANEANNTLSKSTKVLSQVDLTISDLTTSGSQGSEGDVRWTVSKAGAGVASNFVVTVELPVGTIPLNMNSVPDGFSCQIEENPINKVTCHGSMDSGTSSANFAVKTYVTGGEQTANGIVDPDNRVVESNESNNTKTS